MRNASEVSLPVSRSRRAGRPEPRSVSCGASSRESVDTKSRKNRRRRKSIPPLDPGALLFDGYRVNALLRRGDAYDVYDVWSACRSCRCIAKVLRKDAYHPESAKRRLLNEGRLLQRFSHLHLVRGYDTYEGPDGEAAIVLEMLSGETIEHFIGRKGRLSAREVAFLGLHVCSALHYLHNEGVLHLDLKPSNIVACGGIGKLIDLSIAAPPGEVAPKIGTPQYMAPEQVRGGLVGPEADVWGIGAVMFEAATGEMPFGEKRHEYEQVKRPSVPVRTKRRCSRAFAEAIDGCLRTDPSERIRLPELVELLEEVAGEPPAAGKLRFRADG